MRKFSVVEEKATGEISAGAGLGTTGGSIQAGIRENNYLGKGISLKTNLLKHMNLNNLKRLLDSQQKK